MRYDTLYDLNRGNLFLCRYTKFYHRARRSTLDRACRFECRVSPSVALNSNPL